MPWNVLERLEEICIYLNKENIEVLSLIDLEKLLMRRAKISNSKTIDNYIQILIKFGWIKQQPKIKGMDFMFEITYVKDKKELF